MIGQDKQKHNPNSIDEEYITCAPTPTHLEDDVLDTTLSSELHIEGSEDSYPTKHNKNIGESERLSGN